MWNSPVLTHPIVLGSPAFALPAIGVSPHHSDRSFSPLLRHHNGYLPRCSRHSCALYSHRGQHSLERMSMEQDNRPIEDEPHGAGSWHRPKMRANATHVEQGA